MLATDSMSVYNLARMGQARAWLQLGEYARAAQAVGNIPTEFRYEVPLFNRADNRSSVFERLSVSDREGGRGLPYRSGLDTRINARSVAPSTGDGITIPRFLPAKYSPEGTAHKVVLASGVEARLIAAEAALQASNVSGWQLTLNTLRQTATTPALPILNADSTTDATPLLREEVMFQERAYWLLLTAQRQGDLRRRVRVYGRDPRSVYPSIGTTRQGRFYGSDVTLPVTLQQEGANPYFKGCFSRDA